MDKFETSWFGQLLQTNQDFSKLTQNPVAYFCAEFALSDRLPIYSGGLGVLAGDMIKEANDMGIPFIGIGLLYKKGFYKQNITDQNTQIEDPQPVNARTAGLSLVLNNEGNVFMESIPVQGRSLHFQVWHLKIGTVDMYFLDTDVELNNESDRKITETLYGGDQQTRILQEIILGIGGEKTLYAQGIYPSIYHMNEGHSAFAAFGIIHHCMKLMKVGFQEAFESTRKKLVFTNHTLVPAGNDVFPKQTVVDMLTGYANEVGIPAEELISKGLTEDGNTFSMTIFAFNMSIKVNAVSALHAIKAKELWPSYNMESITNGVHVHTWTHPSLYRKLEAIMLEREIGIEHTLQYLSPAQIWELHQDIKKEALRTLLTMTGSIFDKDVLTITWARRIAAYKRPDLIFSDIERLKRILNSIQKPVQLIIAGKPHPKDDDARNILKHILDSIDGMNEPNKVVYIPNYSISTAQLLVAGSDLWLNNPIRGYEACGTSGMKASLNGILQFTVRDGWTDEVDWYGAGWVLDDTNTAESLYSQLENDITGTYYSRRENIPEVWVEMMMKTMDIAIKRYSSRRMLTDYFTKMYTPILNGSV